MITFILIGQFGYYKLPGKGNILNEDLKLLCVDLPNSEDVIQSNFSFRLFVHLSLGLHHKV